MSRSRLSSLASMALIAVTLFSCANPLAREKAGPADTPATPRVLTGNGVTLTGTYTTTQAFSNLDYVEVVGATFRDIAGPALRLTGIGTVIIEDSSFSNIVQTDSQLAAIVGRSNGSVTIRRVSVSNVTGHGIKFPDSDANSSANRTTSILIEDTDVTNVSRIGTLEGTGNGIQVTGTDSLTIQGGCEVSYIADWGIKMGYEASYNQIKNLSVLIQGNKVHDVMGDCILVCETNENVSIIDNELYNIAQNGVGARAGAGDHGIYWQSNVNGLIEGNKIWNNGDLINGDPAQPAGCGISVRSGNTAVRRNTVWNVAKDGIGYYSDHVGSGTNRYENNVIYDAGRYGISIIGAMGANMNPSRVEVDNHYIYGNTIYHTKAWPLDWNDLSEPCYLFVRGNLLVSDGIGSADQYIRQGASAPFTLIPWNDWPGQEGRVTMEQNLKAPLSTPIAGIFTSTVAILPATRDLHLATGSVAIGAASSLNGLIAIDRDNVARSQPVDAGAYEYVGSPSPPMPAPVLTAISPATGNTAGGTSVTLTGTDLSGATVKFGTVSATVTSSSATQVVCTSPTGSAGIVAVTATTAGGTSNGLDFIYSQPAGGGTFTLTTTADSQVQKGKPTSNYGTVTNYSIQYNSSIEYWAYQKFDLAPVTGSTVSSALLKLTLNLSSTATRLDVYACDTDSWTESGITWNNKPALGILLASLENINGTVGTVIQLDVGPFVQSQLAGDRTVSLILREKNMVNKNTQVRSKENATASSRPQLVVVTQ